MSSVLDSVTTDIDNVMIKFLCGNLVLVGTGMPCVATPNLFATSFSCPSAFGIYRDIIFLVTTNIFIFSLSTLSRQDFFESLTISVSIGNSLVAKNFSSLSCRLLRCLLRHTNLCSDTLDLANISSPSISVMT